MTEQMPGELIYEYTIQATGASDGGVSGDGDLGADRGTNPLARQAVLGERAGHHRSNPPV